MYAIMHRSTNTTTRTLEQHRPKDTHVHTNKGAHLLLLVTSGVFLPGWCFCPTASDTLGAEEAFCPIHLLPVYQKINI